MHTFAAHVPGHLRAVHAVRHRDGTYTTTVASDLGVDTRTARRWLKRAAALGLVWEDRGIPPAETFWQPVEDGCCANCGRPTPDPLRPCPNCGWTCAT